ncbi:hypothetical protein B0E33_01325 [Roseibium algicola]|uniref:Uncharacterized protein n=1 Tax=Roseibium algicola TaxID=2857014 RepID=A0ABN4WQR4_9HYPH|nr:hypothetical protein [Roseibium aggregatum]AQQ02396.1 hypothetical protein B0E33_01325 [Roseibium aggregatum]
MKQPANLTFRVALFRCPSTGKHICQGMYRDICTQGNTRDEAITRWQIACRAEIEAVPTIIPKDTPPGVRLMAEVLHKAEFATLEVMV